MSTCTCLNAASLCLFFSSYFFGGIGMILFSFSALKEWNKSLKCLVYYTISFKIDNEAKTQRKCILFSLVYSKMCVMYINIRINAHRYKQRNEEGKKLYWNTNTVRRCDDSNLWTMRCEAKLLKCNTFALFYDWRAA